MATLDSHQVIESRGVIDNDEVGQLGAGHVECLDQILIGFVQVSEYLKIFDDSFKTCVPVRCLKL